MENKKILIVLLVVLIIGVVIVPVIVFSGFFKIFKQEDKIIEDSKNIINNIIDNITDEMNDSDSSEDLSYDIRAFNGGLEMFQGTKNGFDVINLLDTVVSKIKKNSNHQITVVYGEQTLSNVDDIISLKKQFDNTSKYEIYFDYDSDGFINKVTISNY